MVSINSYSIFERHKDLLKPIQNYDFPMIAPFIDEGAGFSGKYKLITEKNDGSNHHFLYERQTDSKGNDAEVISCLLLIVQTEPFFTVECYFLSDGNRFMRATMLNIAGLQGKNKELTIKTYDFRAAPMCFESFVELEDEMNLSQLEYETSVRFVPDNEKETVLKSLDNRLGKKSLLFSLGKKLFGK